MTRIVVALVGGFLAVVTVSATALSPALELGYAIVGTNSERAVSEVAARFIASNSASGLECKKTVPRGIADLNVDVQCQNPQFFFRLTTCEYRRRCPPFRGHHDWGKWVMVAQLHPRGGTSPDQAHARLREFVRELSEVPDVRGVNWAICEHSCIPSL